jgi:hypothetical protein
MADHAVYVYAVGDADLADSAEIAALRGVDDTPARVVVEGGLAAVVGSVDAVRFSEESLRQSLEDLGWLEDTARAHHAVVATLAGSHPVAPVRMATVYVDDDNVRALLREKAAAFADALDRIRGRTEWGVKAYAVPAVAPAAEPSSGAGAGPGTSYLLRRRAEREHATRSHEEALEAADAVHDGLRSLAVASRRYPPQDPRLAGHQDEMVLNAAYLVDEAAAAALREAVDQAVAPGLRLELTGPWAPYSFAALDQPQEKP